MYDLLPAPPRPQILLYSFYLTLIWFKIEGNPVGVGLTLGTADRLRRDPRELGVGPGTDLLHLCLILEINSRVV